MKIGKEFINPRHVVHIYGLDSTELNGKLKYYFEVDTVDMLKHSFFFGSKEYGNRARNELIESVERVNQ